MCDREFVHKTTRSLDDVRERPYFLQYDEIDLWRSVQNFELNIEDTSTIIHELFASTQPTQPFSQVVSPTTNGVAHYVRKYVRKSPFYLTQQHCSHNEQVFTTTNGVAR